MTPSHNKNLEDIRSELIDIIDDHLTRIKIVPTVVYGQPFYFMKSQIIEVPTGVVVNTLDDFIEALKNVDASAIYNHIFEARLRDRQGRSDLSIWLEDAFGLKQLAEKMERIDSYMYSLEGLRKKLIDLCVKEREA